MPPPAPVGQWPIRARDRAAGECYALPDVGRRGERMVIEAEDRLVKLERICERISERLGLVEHRLTAIEPRLASGIVSVAYELKSTLDVLRADLRDGDTRLARQGVRHFYWVVILILGAIGGSLILGRLL